MLLTEAQVHEIKQIIADHHSAFIANTISPEAIAADVLEDLKKKGLVSLKATTIKDAYLYGQVLAAMQNKDAAKMSYTDFKKWLQKNPIPLSAVEQQAVRMAQLQAAQYVKGLGNRVDIATGQILVEADAKLRHKLQTEIQDRTAENIERRESVKQLKSDLGWATDDWARDWDRIAVTEKHNAMQAGMADHLTKRYGPDVLVAKRPMPDACPHCLRLHLGPDGQPRIFRLSDLVAFGNNAGRKTKDWKPSVGAVHPHCQCQMVRVPAGWGFNKEGDLVPGGPLGKRHKDADDLEMSLLREGDLRKSLDGGEKRLEFQGLPVVIETRKGAVRTWQDGQGGTGQTTMLHGYGYVEGTQGSDGEEMDCYVGPDPQASMVYVIHQQNPANGIYDEEKAMLGFANEDAARLAYLAHYDRSGILVAVSPMDMGAFKRWVGSTRVSKSVQAGPRLVILEKSNTTSEDAAQDSRAGARSPSSHGTGVNYYFGSPEREPAKPIEFDRAFTDHLTGKEKRKGLKKDKRDYDMIAPAPKEPVPIRETAAKEHAGSPIGSGLAERNREWLDTHAEQLRGVHNDAPTVRKSEPRLVLSKAFGQQKAGHKYTHREWMKDHWIYEYAKHHGGKVEGHATDLDRMVLKLPSHKHGELHDLRAKHGLKEAPFSGSKHAILDLHRHELAAMALKDTRKQKPALAAPSKAPAKPSQSVAVHAKDLKLLKPVEQADRSGFSKPNWISEHFISTGERVVVGGEAGALTGFGVKNQAIVDLDNGERRIVPWSQVKREGGVEPYKAAYERLPEGRTYKLDARMKAILDKALKVPPLPGATLHEYVDALRDHGAEVYLCGGMVRDLVGLTAVEGQHTDAEVMKAMLDFDLVVTGSPSVALTTLKQLSANLPGVQVFDAAQYGVSMAHASGHPGIDLATVIVEGGYTTPKEPIPVFDHDLEKDTQRRDFTVNSMYLDLVNNAILDPTGLGMLDAQNRVLRLPKMTRQQQYANESLPWRYIKFRARGFTPEAETLKAIREQLTEQCEQDPEHARDEAAKNLNKMFLKKGVPRSTAIARIKAVMDADGMSGLYEKYFAKVYGKG